MRVFGPGADLSQAFEEGDGGAPPRSRNGDI